MALRRILLLASPYPLVGRERSRPNGWLQCFWQLSVASIVAPLGVDMVSVSKKSALGRASF